jgi:MFS superfamily sulfate permease-like transporter
MSKMNHIPATGLKGLVENWRSDLVAAISVALVALPLAMGIAMASGVSPMAGVISAIIGGVVTTFFRGSHVAINGPAAGLIAVILAGISALDDGSGQAINYVLAAIVISGGLQILLGLLKMGRYANLFPSSVIHGILAAIGVIIFAKQMHVALGTTSNADNTMGILIDIFYQLPNANPFVAIISLLGILLMVFNSRISYKLFHFLPTPMWVLMLSLPFVYFFNFFDEHTISLFGKDYTVGPDLLINIPNNPIESIIYPNFSMMGTGAFWLTVLSITMIASVETLASTKAVDKMDDYKRITNLNKDLIGVGISTMVSGALGGLPIITVIVRSTVNVHNHAKTKWSNLYHGILLILFILILAPVLQKVPLAALAIILVYTGFKLASPSVFKRAYDQGVEQLLFLVSTLVITLCTDLLYGIIGGVLVTLTLHMLLAKLGFRGFFKNTFKSGSRVLLRDNGTYDIKLKGIANFLSTLKLNKLFTQIPMASTVTIDLSQSRLVDLTVMENIIEFKRVQDNQGGDVKIIGLHKHVSSGSHNRALKIIPGPVKKRVTTRQIDLQKIARKNGWEFRREVDWNISYLNNFNFFNSRPILEKTNAIQGTDLDNSVRWEISDITFDEGALLSSDVYHTTVHVIHLPIKIPRFTLEKEGLFDRIFKQVREFTGYRDITFAKHPKFSRKFLLLGKDEAAIRELFTDELIAFLDINDIHHIESNGTALMVFNYLHLARTNEVKKMLVFSHELLQHMNLES